MNRLFPRTWHVVAVLASLALIAVYFYFRFMGSSEPVSKSSGTDNYHVATLADYIRYTRNPNRFYSEQSAVRLSFDCERIRDDFVKLTQSIISPELATSADTIVWREGRTLHLRDDSVSGSEPFEAWKNRAINLASVQHPPNADHYGSLLQALFTSISIHGRNDGEDFSVATKRGVQFDACR